MHLRDLTQFLSELEQNNNRAWFVMNRPRYDILRAEFLELVTELIAAIAKFDPAVRFCNPKKALFRINRDVRFSHDKNPYKTVFSAAIVPTDLKRPSDGAGPCYYFQLDGRGCLHFGGGEYIPPAWRVKAIRNRIVQDADGFGAMLQNRALKKLYGDIQPEHKLTRIPKGFAADAPHAEYLKLKSFFIWTEVAMELNAPEKLVPDLAKSFQAALPLIQWLRSVPFEPPATQ